MISTNIEKEFKNEIDSFYRDMAKIANQKK